MAVSKTSTGTKGKGRSHSKKNKLEQSEIPTLARLSLVLDSFRAQALHHFSNGDSVAERKKRAQQIEKRVMSFQQESMKANKMMGCPIGMCDCGGLCMPCSICPFNGGEY